ncbi:MAG: hypothetical protein LBK92_00020 [Endomicrobium sp.]|jgi:hypothetical protein|nr:hypothetical protein [Endomicrobium sp.]
MESLKGDGSDNIETTALLFQTGYLTIKKKEVDNYVLQYTIDFPNYEVKNAFLSSLLKAYLERQSEEINGINKKIEKGLKEKNGENLGKSLRELFANIPYDLTTEEMIEEGLNQIKERRYYEKYEGNDVSLLGIVFGDKKEIGCKFMVV